MTAEVSDACGSHCQRINGLGIRFNLRTYSVFPLSACQTGRIGAGGAPLGDSGQQAAAGKITPA